MRFVTRRCATELGRHPNQNHPGWEGFWRAFPNSLMRRVLVACKRCRHNLFDNSRQAMQMNLICFSLLRQFRYLTRCNRIAGLFRKVIGHHDLNSTVTHSPLPSFRGASCRDAACISAMRLTIDNPNPLPLARVPSGR